MKIKKFPLFLILLLVVFTTLYADGLGLRTPVPATPTMNSSDTAVGANALQLKLKKEDPLLTAFREGLTSPNIPGWQIVKIDGKNFKIPAGFTLSVTTQGKNTDAMIEDESGNLFARLYIYELAQYTTDELFGDLTGSIYGKDATGRREYEEMKKLPDGKEAYLTRAIMYGTSVTYPLLFVYSPGTDPKTILRGMVVMMIFEPAKYTDALGSARAERWIEGMIGNVLDLYGGGQAPQTNVTGSKYGDGFIDGLFGSILSGGKLSYPQSWVRYTGETFGVSIPDYWNVEFFKNPDIEAADIVESDVTIAKVLYGDFGYEYPNDLLDELYGTYLESLGKYTRAKTASIQEDGITTLVYRLDFSDLYCWITMQYKGTETRIDSDSMIVFLGIAPIGNADQRIKDYLALIGSYEPVPEGGYVKTYDDPFIDKLFGLIVNDEYPEVPLDWKDYEGDTMYLYAPPYWDVKFYPTTDFEVADINESETTIAKIFYGYYDYGTPRELLDHLYETYLDSLGKYTLSKEAYIEDGIDSFTVYRLDFKNSYCWVLMVYEGSKNAIDSSYEVFAFIGIAPIKSPDQRVQDYLLMLSNWEESWMYY